MRDIQKWESRFSVFRVEYSGRNPNLRGQRCLDPRDLALDQSGPLSQNLIQAQGDFSRFISLALVLAPLH
jgi:hypothetical protein